MASEAPETAERLPTVHEYGQRALKEPSAGDPSESVPVAGPSPPTPVSPATTEATPAVRRAEPVSPQQQPGTANAADPEQQQQQQQPPPPNHVYTPEKPSALNAWPRRHVILLTLAFVLSIVGLGLAGHSLAYFGFYLQDTEDILSLLGLPLYIITIVFIIAETAVRISLNYHKGFHPAVHTGFWLVCWIIYAAFVIVYGIFLGYDGFDTVLPEFLVQFIFIILLLMTTFGLFILACIDTAAYNSERSRPPPADAIGRIDPDYYADRSWGLTKLVFNAFAIVFGIIGFSLGLSMLQYSSSFRGDNVIYPACACALLLPILWAVADLCYSLTGPRRPFFRGITPAAHVGLWLVSWIVLAIVAGALTALTTVTVAQCGDYSENYLRRSVPIDHEIHRHVPVIQGAPAPLHVRQVAGVSQTNSLPTPTSTLRGIQTLPVSSSILNGIPKATSTTTSRPFGSDPYDDPYYDPYDDPYYTPDYYPRRTSTSSSYRSYPTSTSNGGLGDDDDNYPYNRYPYHDPYEEDQRELCAQKSYKAIMVATVVFMWLVFLFAFVLFVGACSDTQLHNSKRNNLAVMYVPFNQPGLVPSQYAQPGLIPSQYAQPGLIPSQYAQPGLVPSQYAQPMPVAMPMQGNGKQPMTQQPMQQVQPAQGNVVEYYGTAQ
ncbi:hypothetical protein PWT90_01409 [Aphanocladium album]|nr:hypothetical protein PWT90_01409 [Aphanocladium album]